MSVSVAALGRTRGIDEDKRSFLRHTTVQAPKPLAMGGDQCQKRGGNMIQVTG
jgi:hypothetical protein